MNELDYNEYSLDALLDLIASEEAWELLTPNNEGDSE